jgi:hypothetical protein
LKTLYAALKRRSSTLLHRPDLRRAALACSSTVLRRHRLRQRHTDPFFHGAARAYVSPEIASRGAA